MTVAIAVEPKLEPAAVDLVLGDAFAELPKLESESVDVTITDPPFDARTHRTALETEHRRSGRAVDGELPFPPLTDAQVQDVAAELARVTRRWIVLFCADRQIETWSQALEAASARVLRVGVALRTNPRPQMTGDRPAQAADWLVIAHSSRRPPKWNGGGRAACWQTPPARHDPGGQVHPTQKPLCLMRALVEDFSEPRELVLDPFAGAGTTAVACKELGRAFLGFERDPGYYEAALRRLDNTREQLRLAPLWG